MRLPTIVLASSSPYRKALLNKLQIAAQCISPDINERPLHNESPSATALRLAIEKAKNVAQRIQAQQPNAIIIGSDQVACIAGKQLGKPGSTAKAFAQLRAQSGQTVVFHTALCIQKSTTIYSDVITTEVVFRTLSKQEITRYIELENPIDCAGSFKCEGLGSLLFKRVTSDDPSALIGLPLIRTTEFLRKLGVNPLLTTAPPLPSAY